MTIAESSSRFTIVLSPSILLERLILDRLQTLTGATRQHWLRSLLVEGFLVECRTLRTVRDQWLPLLSPHGESRRLTPKSAPYAWASTLRFTGNSDPVTPRVVPTVDVTATTLHFDKPFAHLRRVIGRAESITKGTPDHV